MCIEEYIPSFSSENIKTTWCLHVKFPHFNIHQYDGQYQVMSHLHKKIYIEVIQGEHISLVTEFFERHRFFVVPYTCFSSTPFTNLLIVM